MKKALFVLALPLLAFLTFSCKKNDPQPLQPEDYVSRGGGGAAGSEDQPCPVSFKRNNGQGTCNGDGQIRAEFDKCPDYPPTLDSIYYNGAKIEGLTYGIGDPDHCHNNNGYISYCFFGHNIPPEHKLTLYFSYPLNNQNCVLGE